MERRIILFLVLSLGIIFAYPVFLEKFAPEIAPPKQKTSPVSLKPEGAGAPILPLQNQSSDTGASSSSQGTLPLQDISAPPKVALPAEKLKVIEGDLYRVVLSSRGGTIKEWTLKKYTTKDDKGVEKPIQLVSPSGKFAPLAVTVAGDDSFTHQTYSLDETPIRLDKSKLTTVVVMSATTSNGRTLTKELTFYNDQYQADIRVKSNDIKTGYQVSLGSNFGITDWARSFGGAIGSVSMINGKVVSENPENTTTYETGATWSGLADTYYMSAFMPVSSASFPISVQGISETEVAAAIKIAGDSSRDDKWILYAGPKEYDRLASYNKYLEEAIDFGWFIFGSLLPVRLVAKPLFYVLRFIYSVTQNYGVAIILLTIFVKILFHPITKKGLTSMKQMATLQPKVNAIREKWSDNKEKMNKELMSLYKDTGINPFGGCMPMLLQMPVFIALFNVLYVTIDLKGAPFMLWITDLSDKDPYYVLPIIMGATMILQQMTQPNVMDPIQAKIMLFMPVIYTFFFLSFPSGLVLYWLVNNSLSIAQQYWINKQNAVTVT
ncbi:MAG: membrane protein insertase YidC [Nitrospirota bacterium]